jgi:hypothetical protein
MEIGCKVSYQKSHLVEPRKIRTHEDVRPGTKKGMLDRKPIWIVEITMPKKIAFDIYKGYMDKLKNEDKKTTASEGGPAEAAAPAAPAAPGGMPAAPAAPAAPGGMPA